MKVFPTSKERRRPLGNARLVIPPIGLLFCAFAVLAFRLIDGELRSDKALLEAGALQMSSNLVESHYSSPESDIEPKDSTVLSFGIYKPNGRRAAGFGEAPTWDRLDSVGKEFLYDAGAKSLTVLRPLVTENGHRPKEGAAPELQDNLDERQKFKGFVRMTLDISDYYRKRGLLAAASVLAPLLILVVGALFISLLLKNLRYREVAEKRESLAFLGESARTLVHEIRNPLGAIRLQVGVLRRKFSPGELSEVDAIEEETLRLDLLVRRISDFLKNPGGEPRRFELGAFLEDFASRSQGALRFEPAEAKAFVRFDPELLRSVLENLARNALESYEEEAPEKEVLLSLEVRGGAAAIAVKDRGKGIAEGLREKIFDPFFTDKPQGSGIGLPLARRFVEAAGGSLRLEPRKGGGTEARISLPLAEER